MWSLREVWNLTMSSCRSQGTGHRGNTHTPITEQRAGNWRGDQLAAPLTVTRAVCFRVGSLPVRLHVHDLSLKRDSHQHTRHHREASDATGHFVFYDLFVSLYYCCLDASSVECQWRARFNWQYIWPCSSCCLICLCAFSFCITLVLIVTLRGK